MLLNVRLKRFQSGLASRINTDVIEADQSIDEMSISIYTLNHSEIQMIT